MFILISTVRKPIFHPNFKCFRNSTLKKKKAEHSRSRVRKRKLWKMFLRENEKKEICYVCNDRVPPFQLYSHSRRNRNVNPAYIFTRKRGFLPRILDNCKSVYISNIDGTLLFNLSLDGPEQRTNIKNYKFVRSGRSFCLLLMKFATSPLEFDSLPLTTMKAPFEG